MMKAANTLVMAMVLALLTAQAYASPPVVGVLSATDQADDAPWKALRQGLADFGYVEGQNIRIEYRLSEGKLDRLPALAEELVKLKVSVIVAVTEYAVRAAQEATSTIPIVMIAYANDPVAAGLVTTLARPGGNITGIYPADAELVGKRLELLKDLVPRATRIAALWDKDSPLEIELLKPIAKSMGLQLIEIEVPEPYDFTAAYRSARAKKCDAVMILFSRVSWRERGRIPAIATAAKLPTIYWNRSSVEAGGLISYSPIMSATFGRAAYFIDRLLKGAKPSELPFEQPSRVHLAVNLSAARALGIVVPESILLRADEVIR
jgi:putative ABC transport system substrate-binding protein